jgi:GNAT superfamily N-acetyltransferase
MGWLSLFERRGGAIASPGHPAASPPASGANDVEVVQVTTRRQVNQFAEFPARVNAGDPNWVPRLLVEVKEFLDPKKHPFYLHGAAAQFLAMRHGEPVGRILVSDDPAYNEFHATNLGCFGMFECVDDPQVASALLDAAAGWLLARGRDAMMGPIDFSMNYPCGLLVEGFDTPPRTLMNHNPPYYARLLEQWGLKKAKDLFAWWFDDSRNLVTGWRRLAGWLARRGRIHIRPFSMKDFDAEVKRCNAVYAAGTAKNWGFVRLSDAEFHHLAKQIAKFAVPEQVLIAEIDGKPVGFSITLPDVNEAVRPLKGRLTSFGLPIGLIRLLFRMRRIKNARMMVLVVLEEYRRRGVSELLILRTLDYGKNVLGYAGAELSWTLEDNDAISRTIEAVGARRYKRYRIYEKNLQGKTADKG